MTSSMITSKAATFVAGQKVRSSVVSRSAATPKVVVKAMAEDKVATVDRSKDFLYFASPQSLSYLDGSLAGDFGFDPLGVSDPEGAGGLITPSWLAYAEVIHCRFAMLGAAGCLAPEALGKMGVIPESTGLVWFRNGVVPPSGEFDYWCDPYSLFIGELVLMGFAETRRLMDYRNPGSMGKQYFIGLESVLGGSGDPAYPGGQFFNMMNFGSKDMDDMKLKEIKNGRLAMIALLGFFVQAMVTGDGPVQNFLDHAASPMGSNMLTNFGKIGGGI